MAKKKAEFVLSIDWRDPDGGICEAPLDGEFNTMAYPQERPDARSTAEYYAGKGFWLNRTHFIAPACILAVHLVKAK